MIYGIAFGTFECACQAGAGNLYLGMGDSALNSKVIAFVGRRRFVFGYGRQCAQETPMLRKRFGGLAGEHGRE